MNTTGAYRKVSLRMWQDLKFRALSPPPPSGQTLWVYVITGEHTTAIPGLSRVGELGLAEALGWDIRSFRAMWSEIAVLGMASADWNARVLWVPNAIKYNPPENPNVVKSWARVWSELPECPMKEAAAAVLLAHMRTRGDGFVQAFTEACPSSHAKRSRKASPAPRVEPSPQPSTEPSPEPTPERSGKRSGHGLANQEQEQEQEPKPAGRPARVRAKNGLVEQLRSDLSAHLGREVGGGGKDPERLGAEIERLGYGEALAAAKEVADELARRNDPLRTLAALPGWLATVEKRAGLSLATEAGTEPPPGPMFVPDDLPSLEYES